MRTSSRYSPELRELAVRLVLEHQGEHSPQWATIESIDYEFNAREREAGTSPSYLPSRGSK